MGWSSCRCPRPAGVDVMCRSYDRQGSTRDPRSRAHGDPGYPDARSDSAGPAPDVSDKTAFIQGDVLSNRTESGEAWFKYGTTSTYGQETPHGDSRVRGRRQAGLLRAPVRTRPSHDLPLRPLRRGSGPGVRRASCSGDQTFTTVGDHIRGTLQVLGREPGHPHHQVQRRRERIQRRGPEGRSPRPASRPRPGRVHEGGRPEVHGRMNSSGVRPTPWSTRTSHRA